MVKHLFFPATRQIRLPATLSRRLLAASSLEEQEQVVLVRTEGRHPVLDVAEDVVMGT